MKNAEIIAKLNLEQKCALLSGAGTFTTRGCPKAGVPSITLSDGPNGVRKQAGAADHLGLNPSVPATCFPTAATVACSWDPALGEEIGRAMGEEAAAQEVAVLLGPGLNTKRSPLCGRNFEYFSEDPYLSGKMAAAYVRGIQSEGIAACPKHFAVNSQELRRMASDSVLDERTLRELYLTGFEIVVKEAAPKTIMSSYNLVNGTYANENAHLLQDILRRDWGFSGAVVTDWGGSNDHALGVKNGSTLEMPAPGGDAVRELLAAVKSGKITEADRTMIGNPTPDFTYGYSVNLQYKNFDLGIDFQGVYGNEIFNTSFLSAYAQYNYHTKRLGRWNGEGTSNWEPILDSSRATQMMNSSYFIEDGSYLRLKNIQLGYSFGDRILKKIRLKALRVFMNIDNLATWSHNTGYTPEIGGTALAFGIDTGDTYPMPTTITFGVNVSF